MNSAISGHGGIRPLGAVARSVVPSIAGLSVLGPLALMVGIQSRFLADSDTGWHVVTGDLIRQTGSIPRTDTFSFTMTGDEWFAWEWLSDWLMSLIHQAYGLGGLVVASFFVLTVGYGLLSRHMRWRGADSMVAAPLLFLAAMLAATHWLARPHLLSILLLVVWAALVEAYRRTRTKWVWSVPALIVVWANLHGAFVVTFPLLAIYAAGEWLEQLWRGEGRSVRTLRMLRDYASLEALTFVAGLLTPYGFDLYRHLYTYLTDAGLLESVREFAAPNFHDFDGKLVELMIVLGFAALVSALRRRRCVEPLLVLFWAHMTLTSIRHVTLAAVMLMPIVAEELTHVLRECLGQEGRVAGWLRRLERRRGGMMAIDRQLNDVGLWAAEFMFFAWLIASPGLTKRLVATEFAPERFPVAAADFIERNRTTLAGNMFVRDQFAGYVIYRFGGQLKVFEDGRSDFYRRGSVFDDAVSLTYVKPEWAALLQSYVVESMLLRRDEALAVTAIASGEWTAVYRDTTAEVLVRRRTTGR